MGSQKDAMIDRMEEERYEVVAECETCGGPVTNEEYTSLIFDGGKPFWVICDKCRYSRTDEYQDPEGE